MSNVSGSGGCCSTSLISQLIIKSNSFDRRDNFSNAIFDISQAETFNPFIARHIAFDPYPQARSRALPFTGKRC